jgi:Transcriptional regulator, AbiEi antitoxin, Type IV TA system/Transcriptional regulator, AbiEi antitoxin N-terminal domain
MNNISKQTKINQLISNWPKSTLKTVKELESLGYTPQLLKVYSNSHWIELFTRGMYKLYNDEVTWQGALHGMQQGSNTTLHAGGKTALTLKGYGHYLSQQKTNINLFCARNESIPAWIKKFPEIMLIKNEVFNYIKEENFIMFNAGTYNIQISSPELAAIEMLYLIPKAQSFDEAAKIMEGLTTLRPKLVQNLLQECNSVKVKRLFLFIAEKHDHQWVKELKLENINLGSGKRVIVEDGVLDKKYHITIPREYAG